LSPTNIFEFAFKSVVKGEEINISNFQVSQPNDVNIKNEDANLPAFYFDPLINFITHRNAPKYTEPLPDDDEEFQLPDDVQPFLVDTPLYG
jgi:hypothetical protein